MVITEPFCPYVGLQPYTEADHDYFFGRERDQRIIAANLYAAPLTVLYGASGVGKSSVLLAGVVPYLRTRPRTAVVVFREWQGVSFLASLKAECLQAVAAAQQKPLAVDTSLPFDEFLDATAQAFGGSILILFDQFEEYFLYHPEAETANTFDAELARAINRDEIDASFLIALREDGLSKLDRFRARIPNLLSNTLRLQHLNAADAEAAIRKPLEVYNERFSTSAVPVTIEDELIREIIAQVRTGQVSLGQLGGSGQAQTGDATLQIEVPFLQLVMTRLWNEERQANSHALRLSTLQHLGGAQEIVRTHLDGVMAKLDTTEQEVCSRFFDRLVTPSGSKIACRVADLTDWAGSLASRVPLVIKSLSDSRILRSIASPGERQSDTSYEIYHDVLAPAVLDWRTRYVQEQEQATHQQELRQAKASARRAKVFAGIFSVLCLLAIVAAVFAFRERNRAERQAQVSSSLQLAANAINNLNVDPERSILLALQAVSKAYSVDKTIMPEAEDTLHEAENALHRAVLAPRAVTFTGHTDAVYGIAFSPDGTRLATASKDDTAKVWDAASGKALLTLTGHTDSVHGIAFSPDGKHLATASLDKTAKVWDAASGKALLTLTGHTYSVFRIAFSPDGKHLATASQDKTAKVWDVASGKALLTLTGHTDSVIGIAFSPDGKHLATASNDKTAKVWDVASGKELLTLTGHTDAVNGIAFSPDGTRLATASNDKTAKVWDAASGKELLTLTGHTDAVYGIAFSPDGTRLATASRDKTAKVWDVASGKELFTLTDPDSVDGVAFSPDGTRLATASWDQTAKVWDAASGKELLTLTGHTDRVYGIAFSPDGKHLATASRDKTAKVWDVASGKELLTLTGHTDLIWGIAFSPDGTRLATASKDNTAKVWDAASGKELVTLTGHTDAVNGIAFSPDGTRLATASNDKTAKVWDAASGKELFTLTDPDLVNDVAFSPDGSRLATASGDKTAKVWDAASGKELLTLTGHTDRVYGIAFSPDGKHLATASADKTAKVWDAASGKALHTLTGHTSRVLAIAFSPDGTRLATASWDQTAKVWDAASGKELLTLTGHTGEVYGIAFSPDGKHLATTSSDRTAQVYALDIDELIALAKTRVTRSLTTDECQKYLRVEQCPPPP